MAWAQSGSLPSCTLQSPGRALNLLMLRSYLQRFLFNCSRVQPGMRLFTISSGLLVLWDCHNKLSQMEWLRAIVMYSLKSSGGQKFEVKLWEALGENLFLPLLASGGCQCSLASWLVAISLQSLPPSSYHLLLYSLFSSMWLLQGHLSSDLGPTCITQHDLISRP